MIFDPALSAIAATPVCYVPLTRHITFEAIFPGPGPLNPPLGSTIAMHVTVAAVTRFFLEWQNPMRVGSTIR